jgi:hypothetical protein
MMANVGSSAVLTSSSIQLRAPKEFGPDPNNSSFLNLDLIANSPETFGDFGSGSTDIFNFQISEIDLNIPSPPGNPLNASITALYTSTTTITNLDINDVFGIVDVEGGGFGTYFEQEKRVTINQPTQVKVNGELLDFNLFDYRFALESNNKFFHFQVFVPDLDRSSIRDPKVGSEIPGTELRAGEFSDLHNTTYQLIRSAPNTGVVPEPSTSVLALLAIGVAGRFVRKRFSTKGPKSKV